MVQRQSFCGERRSTMARKHGVSGKTHTKQQLDAYANQHNPNNKAYQAELRNQAEMQRRGYAHYDLGILGGESYGWCDD